MNQGKCIKVNETSYGCICVSGWTGSNCHIDINECALNPCLNGAKCKQLQPPKFQCECASGYHLFYIFEFGQRWLLQFLIIHSF